MVSEVSCESSRKAFLIELRQRIIRISIAVIAIISICMTMSITTFDFGGYKMLIFYPDTLHNISSQIISFMKDTLLPKNVGLIQISPGQAFSAQIHVSVLTGVIIA
ncbi:MAG: twin-arginine translocase subunit TatC, partial [Nitrosopumilus sp.]|nr:twin-arginine translocase subunit TatC [Nitrosopumilus sp.]